MPSSSTAKTGTLPVVFSACTTAQLRDIAVRAVDGQFTADDLPSKPPATYNSGAMIEMHAAMAKTSAAEIDAKVKIAAPAPKSIDARRTVAPYAATVKNIVADLFLNKDTWAFDASATGQAQPGERVRKLLLEHEPELAFILKASARRAKTSSPTSPRTCATPPRASSRTSRSSTSAALPTPATSRRARATPSPPSMRRSTPRPSSPRPSRRAAAR